MDVCRLAYSAEKMLYSSAFFSVSRNLLIYPILESDGSDFPEGGQKQVKNRPELARISHFRLYLVEVLQSESQCRENTTDYLMNCEQAGIKHPQLIHHAN